MITEWENINARSSIADEWKNIRPKEAVEKCSIADNFYFQIKGREEEQTTENIVEIFE